MKITPFRVFDKLIDFSFKRNGLFRFQVDLGEYFIEYWISKKKKAQQ